MHLCWGNYEGPHHCDVPLADVIDIVLRARPSAISLEAANPRHAHEWKLFETVKLPEGKLLIPGVIESKSNFIEHPELVAQRIGRYAKLVGRENVIAGSDCGFGTWVGQAAVDPDVVWAKMAAMAEGARHGDARILGPLTDDHTRQVPRRSCARSRLRRANGAPSALVGCVATDEDSDDQRVPDGCHQHAAQPRAPAYTGVELRRSPPEVEVPGGPERGVLPERRRRGRVQRRNQHDDGQRDSSHAQRVGNQHHVLGQREMRIAEHQRARDTEQRQLRQQHQVEMLLQQGCRRARQLLRQGLEARQLQRQSRQPHQHRQRRERPVVPPTPALDILARNAAGPSQQRPRED